MIEKMQRTKQVEAGLFGPVKRDIAELALTHFACSSWSDLFEGDCDIQEEDWENLCLEVHDVFEFNGVIHIQNSLQAHLGEG